MADFYLLEFHGGPNNEELWPYAAEKPAPPLFVGQYKSDHYEAETGIFHYVWNPENGN